MELLSENWQIWLAGVLFFSASGVVSVVLTRQYSFARDYVTRKELEAAMQKMTEHMTEHDSLTLERCQEMTRVNNEKLDAIGNKLDALFTILAERAMSKSKDVGT